VEQEVINIRGPIGLEHQGKQALNACAHAPHISDPLADDQNSRLKHIVSLPLMQNF
jgi:hypothetical protein